MSAQPLTLLQAMHYCGLSSVGRNRFAPPGSKTRPSPNVLEQTKEIWRWLRAKLQ